MQGLLEFKSKSLRCRHVSRIYITINLYNNFSGHEALATIRAHIKKADSLSFIRINYILETKY